MGKVVDEYNPMMAALVSIPVPVIAEISGCRGRGLGNCHGLRPALHVHGSVV